MQLTNFRSILPLYPLSKVSENQRFSDVFRGNWKRILAKFSIYFMKQCLQKTKKIFKSVMCWNKTYWNKLCQLITKCWFMVTKCNISKYEKACHANMRNSKYEKACHVFRISFEAKPFYICPNVYRNSTYETLCAIWWHL